MFSRSLFAVFSLLCCVVSTTAQTCARPGPVNPLGAEIANVALREFQEVNGHRINADGYLWKFGATESETELLRDPKTGRKANDRSGRYVWRRVWEYWLALDLHAEGEAMHRKIVFVPGLLGDAQTTEKARELELRTLFANLTSSDENSTTAFQESAVRAAMNDSAWSAAFVSYVMDQARLDNAQFRYAPAHWQYIKRSFEEPDGYAYRACDPMRTVPRAGDLLCMARGAQPLKTFAEWERAVQNPKFSTPSHCEVVTEVDRGASKMAAVGGNVLQSLALRRLKLNSDGVLSASHHPDSVRRAASADCGPGKQCPRENFNLQYWAVLLQLK